MNHPLKRSTPWHRTTDDSPNEDFQSISPVASASLKGFCMSSSYSIIICSWVRGWRPQTCVMVFQKPVKSGWRTWRKRPHDQTRYWMIRNENIPAHTMAPSNILKYLVWLREWAENDRSVFMSGNRQYCIIDCLHLSDSVISTFLCITNKMLLTITSMGVWHFCLKWSQGAEQPQEKEHLNKCLSLWPTVT